MSLKDCRGNPLSSQDPGLLAQLERATELSVSYFVDPLATIDAALGQDPDFAMGHCLRAGLALMSTELGARPLLEQSVTALERLGPRLHPRERAHAAAARAWLDGELARSVRLYGEVLNEYPRDLLALQIAHVGDFLLGASTLLRDRVAQVLPYWDASVPGHGYVLGMHAFGLEETGLYEHAEETGRRALQLNRRDPWAVHAVAHVMEMQGRQRDGITFLDISRLDWAPGNGFAFHNFWHLALFHLDLGENARALELYDQHIRPGPTRIAYENVDASALLWRLELRGVDTGERWQALADDWQAMGEDGHYAFNDVHALLALLGAGRPQEAERVLRALEQRAAGTGTNAMLSREVGVPLAQALCAFHSGRYRECCDLLLDTRSVAHRFGGSNAQRDLLHLTLVEAALRAGNGPLAAALASERTELRPSSPFNWRLAARAFELARDSERAQSARARAAQPSTLRRGDGEVSTGAGSPALN